MDFNHKTVLLDETLEFLNINPDGVYVDGTAGGAGLSSRIAFLMSKKGRLICIDQDPDAIIVCQDRLKEFSNVNIVHNNFSNIDDVVHNLGINKVDGIVLDLGVSSYQLDATERGFSYNKDAYLDMRMSKSGMSAFDVVNFLDINELKNIIFRYGEERFAARIAQKIADKRLHGTINTTTELAEIVKSAIPCSARRSGGHPAKRTFQAIRIYVNRELENLEVGLDKSFELLKSGGRLVVITFHSLEDRIVKERMVNWSRGCTCPSDFPICVCGNKPKAKVIHKKAIIPSKEELERNNRSRSAKLRICEKII